MAYPAWVDEAWNKSTGKIRRTSERIGASFPHLSIDGRYDDETIDWWTNGFWPGLLWVAYRENGDESLRRIAEECEAKMDKAFLDFYGLHHDVGFMWLLSAVADFRITGNPDSRRRGLLAANLLAGRFNHAGRYIRAWNDDKVGWAIIDSLMNIPLLHWASEETGDPRFSQIARLHADKLLEHFVRPDGSVHHIVEFDPETGEFVQAFGGQGYALGSAWSRGQAWAIHGFVLSYNHTKERRYLDAARRVGHFFIASLPDDSVPPCDFRCPNDGLWIKDATAGSCAASAFLDIAAALPELDGALFRRAAEKMLRSLYENCGAWDSDEEGILTKGTMAYHQERGRNVPIIYGDYFFVEALAKLRGETRSMW